MKSISVICLILITALVSTPLSFAVEEEKGHICFITIDADKDEKVTFEEFVEYLGDDKEKFKSVDQNGDGKLTHDEYHESLGHGASDQEKETE